MDKEQDKTETGKNASQNTIGQRLSDAALPIFLAVLVSAPSGFYSAQLLQQSKMDNLRDLIDARFERLERKINEFSQEFAILKGGSEFTIKNLEDEVSSLNNFVYYQIDNKLKEIKNNLSNDLNFITIVTQRVVNEKVYARDSNINALQNHQRISR
ncbi:hypothetical protein IWQ54_006580 [Labrenzia sp. EL_195]|nr:hypothetical protein [Labrenzia sp. EL_195]